MFTCREVSELIGTEGLSSATWFRRLAARIHLLMCRHCRAYADQLRAIAGASRRAVRSSVPDPERLADLEHKITQTLRDREDSKESNK